MLTIVKPVYYCDHCKRHRITASAIEKHEPKCIYNPERSACGWCQRSNPSFRVEQPSAHVPAFIEDPDVARLRTEMDGCPACMLAVIVQARRAGLSDAEAWGFDYRSEVERFQKEENHDDLY